MGPIGNRQRQYMISDILLTQVLDFSRSCIPKGSSLAIAVSGGSDSVALFHILIEIKELLGIRRFAVIHCNHGLRGDESNEDEAFVVRLAEQAGCTCYTTRFSGKKAGDRGLEVWGRENRYQYFHEVKKEHGYDLAATGHTADDQAETLIARCMRGTGFTGMSGINKGKVHQEEPGVIGHPDVGNGGEQVAVREFAFELRPSRGLLHDQDAFYLFRAGRQNLFELAIGKRYRFDRVELVRQFESENDDKGHQETHEHDAGRFTTSRFFSVAFFAILF